jgi:hypothetical protein
MSNHPIISKYHILSNVTTNEHSRCTPNNITIIPDYRTSDSLCYQVSRCNYCGKEWGEFWVSYKYIFSLLIDRQYTNTDIQTNFAIAIIGMAIVCIILMGFPLAFMLANSFRMRRNPIPYLLQ